MNQPSAPPHKIDVVHNRANNHMVLTLVMMVLCFLHGNLPAFICLVPALCFAVVVSRHNKSHNNVNKQQARIKKVNGRTNGLISFLLLLLHGLVNLSAGKFYQSTTGPYINFSIWGGAMSLAEVENMSVLRLFTAGGMLPQESFDNFRCSEAHFGAF